MARQNFLFPFWSVLCSLAMTSHRATSSPFLFLGLQHEEKLLESSIEFSFEKQRLELTSLMQALSSPLSRNAQFSPFSNILQNILLTFHEDIARIPSLWEENETLLRQLLEHKVPFVYCISNNAEDESPGDYRVSSYNSFHQLLIHLERDWGEGGKNVRRTTYAEGILPLLRKHLPLEGRPHVLVPGAGLGRLAVELAAMGYR
jgi:hypothetical protein